MKYPLCLCLFLLLNFSPSFQLSECESVSDPTGLSSCKGKKTSLNTETCCYSKYNDDMDGNSTECIEINSEDAETNEKLESTLFSIINGDYWGDYTDSYNSLNVDCGNGTVYVNKNNECNDAFPDDYSSCKGKSTLSNSYTCCYAYSDDDDEACLNIKKEDAEDEDKLKAATEKINQGQYWEGYNVKYNFEIDCSSRFLKGIFIALFAVYLL